MAEPERSEKIYRGSTTNRVLRNFDEDEQIFHSAATPRRPEYDGDIPPLVPALLYQTTSPTRAAYYARTIPEENSITDIDRPVVLEMEAEPEQLDGFDTTEWEKYEITDYTATEFPSSMVSEVYILPDEDIGEQLPEEEKVNLSDCESWDFEEYTALHEFFPELNDATEIL